MTFRTTDHFTPDCATMPAIQRVQTRLWSFERLTVESALIWNAIHSDWTEYATSPSVEVIMFNPAKRHSEPNVVAFKKLAAEIACKDNLEFMRSLPDGSMNLIVTSPPYNMGKEYERRTSNEIYIEHQAATIAEAARLLHPSGSVCWQVGNHVDDGEIFPLDILLYPLFKNHGLRLRNRIVWTFGHGLHCQRRFSGRHETILWFTKSDDYIFNLDAVRVPSKYPWKKHFKGPKRGQLSSNPLGKNPADVWEIPNVKANHVEKTAHPCQFPVGLVEKLVLALTNEGDNVLDPFMGVGSSAIAALKNGRNAYGCDVMPDYVETALERVKLLEAGELRTRPMDKPIYVPTERASQ